MVVILYKRFGHEIRVYIIIMVLNNRKSVLVFKIQLLWLVSGTTRLLPRFETEAIRVRAPARVRATKRDGCTNWRNEKKKKNENKSTCFNKNGNSISNYSIGHKLKCLMNHSILSFEWQNTLLKFRHISLWMKFIECRLDFCFNLQLLRILIFIG